MASYAGSGSERGRGGRGAGQAGFSGGDTSGVGGGFEGGGGKDGLSTLSPQQQQAINDAIMADIAADLSQQQAQQNVDAISGLAGEIGLTPRETEIAMERAMRGAMAMQTAQMFSPLSWIGKSLGLLQDPRIAARRSMINLANLPNAGFVGGYLTAPTSKGSLRQGGFGQITYSGMSDPTYEGAFSNLVNPPEEDRGGGRPQQVAPVQDPMTGQARCPEGYVFSEALQACIMDTSATSPIAAMPPSYMPPSGGYYARQGLLDQPPAGLLEAGFGTPQDFAAANTAFRMGAATRPDIYSDPYNLQGYTLLS